MEITLDFKNQVVEALKLDRKNFEGSDRQFAKKWNLSPSVLSRVMNGERDKIVTTGQWFNMGRDLDVLPNKRKMKIVRTSVFSQIEEEVLFCKRYSKSMMFIDKNEIGKTVTARHLSRSMPNCFYVSSKNMTTKNQLLTELARAIGVDIAGRFYDIERNIVYYLNMIKQPIVLIDDPGYLDYYAILKIKNLIDSTENSCAWYLVGDESFRRKMNNGMRQDKMGYKALFSRLSGKFSHIVPSSKKDKMSFYKQLVTDVITGNIADKKQVLPLVKKCIIEDEFGNINALRRAESLLILNEAI